MNIKKQILTIFFLGLVSAISAQNSLEIKNVFKEYGKSKGVTMVELSNKKLGNYTFSLFKSLTIKGNDKALNSAKISIEKDQKNAKKVKQVMVNGTPQSLILELPKKDDIYRIILFNNAPNSPAVLIYIESKTNSEEILKYILNKNN